MTNEAVIDTLVAIREFLHQQPQNSEVDGLIRQIKGLIKSHTKGKVYRIKTSEDVVQLAIRNGQLVRGGLEMLLGADFRIFRGVVPQPLDEQTGLFNKRLIEHGLLPLAIYHASQHKHPLSYVLCDLDEFHNFNVTNGLQRGDDAISAFADLLRLYAHTNEIGQVFRKALRFRGDRRGSNEVIDHERRQGYGDRRLKDYDYLSRILSNTTPVGRVGGGEEFAIILYGCTEEQANSPANRLKEELSRIRIPHEGESLSITTSIGIAQLEPSVEAGELRRKAEIAMLFSKDTGRNKVTLYSQVPKDYVPASRHR